MASFDLALASDGDEDVPKSVEDARVGMANGVSGHGHNANAKQQQQSHGGSQMNMRGVFLHVMADALGSVVVIISAVIMWQTDWEYKYYVDPGKETKLNLPLTMS